MKLKFNKPNHNYLSYLSKLNFTLKSKYYVTGCIVLFCSFIITINLDSVWSKDIGDLSPIPEEVKKLDKKLRQAIGAPDVNHVFIIKSSNPEKVLQHTEELHNKLLELKNQGIIKNVFSVSDFIPSQKTQRLYQEQLPTGQNLKLNLEKSYTQFHFKKSFFNPFIEDIETSKKLAPLNLQQILTSPLGKNLQQDIFFKNNEWVSIIRLTGVDNESLLLNWISSQPKVQPYYLNLRLATSSLMSSYQETALYRLLLGFFIISLILFSVRSRYRAGLILLPVILAVLLSLSIQVMLGNHLTLFHILALLLIVGIGLDYSLFFDRDCTSSVESHGRLHGIFVSASSTLITFGILGFSDVPVLSALGQTVTFGVLGCFVLTLIFNINNHAKSKSNAHA